MNANHQTRKRGLTGTLAKPKAMATPIRLSIDRLVRASISGKDTFGVDAFA
jgi:hypothetical protein